MNRPANAPHKTRGGRASHDKAETWERSRRFPEYEVSSWGSVRRVVSRNNVKAGKILSPGTKSNGYLVYCLYDPQIARGRTVHAHRLVLETFEGPPPPGKPHVGHSDGDRKNNHLENLRWVDRSDNAIDQRVHGTNRRSSLSVESVSEIKRLWTGKYGNATALSRQFGTSPQNIRYIATGKTWAHVRG